MRRYPIYLILMLSFAMPLQVVADALLSVLPCPDQVSMVAEPGHHSDSDMADMATMDCCDDAAEVLTSADCGSMKNCHLFKTGGQFYAYTLELITVIPATSLELFPPDYSLTSFSPADVWRPPTHS